MHCRTVRGWRQWILLSFAPLTLLLSGCAPQIVYKDRVVTEYVPQPIAIAPGLTLDCEPAYTLPAAGQLPLLAVFNRLDAVEEALAMCRAQLDKIRELEQPADVSDQQNPTGAAVRPIVEGQVHGDFDAARPRLLARLRAQ